MAAEESKQMSSKRVRKSTEIFVSNDGMATQKETIIQPGIGMKLEDMPNVVSNFEEVTWSNPHLKMLHTIAFGQGKKKEFKSKLLQFSGLPYMVKKGDKSDDNNKDDDKNSAMEEDTPTDDNNDEQENEKKDDDDEGKEEKEENEKKDGDDEGKEEEEEKKVEEKKVEEKKVEEKGNEEEDGDKKEGAEEKGEEKEGADKNVEDDKEVAKEGGKKGGKSKNEKKIDNDFLDQERVKILLKIKKLKANDLKVVMDLVDVERDPKSFDDSKSPTKEMLTDRLLEWLEKPEESGRNKRKMKQLKGAAKGGRKSVGSATKKRKSTATTPKSSSTTKKEKRGRKKKKISDDTEEDDEEVEAEVVESTEEKSPVKKIKFNIPGCTIKQVRAKVKDMVEKGDKNELSVKSVRLSLEEWLDCSLIDSKDIIRSIVMDAMK